MKLLFLILGLTFAASDIKAQSRLEKALNKAGEKHGLVLLNFSGSDWCIPCIKLHKTIIEASVFQQMVSDSSVLYINADFPRSKKNQLPDEIKKENAALADQYNPNGTFPCTILLDAHGNTLKRWDGLPKEDAATFVQEIKALNH